MEKKDLYMGKSLKDLEAHYKVDSAIIKQKAIPQLLLALKKILEKAEMTRLEGDEEQSYCLYMRFMNVLSRIQKTPDFTKEKILVNKTLGNNEKMKKNMDNLEALSKSLKLRYEAKYPSIDLPIAESTRIGELNDTFKEAENTVVEVREIISCKDLFDMIEKGEKLLIMDCRKIDDYENSKMIYKFTMNVPENILVIGMTASKIQERLPNESKVFWEMRDKRPLIIFVDWSSIRFNRNSPVWHLKEILLEWDQDVEKKPEMLLLEGGYERWKTLYPMKCHNPQFSPPKLTNGDFPALNDIEYPNWEDIKMKDTSIPQVDRSRKPNAVKAYEKTKLELLEESQKVLNKSLQNERELLNLEQDLKNVVTDKENSEDSTAKEQSYLFKIYELQAKQDDINLDEKSIKQELEHSKEIIPQDSTKVAQAEMVVTMLETERLKIHEELEKKRKEREKALELARTRKPTFSDHRTPPKSQRKDELILSPKTLSNQVPTPQIPSFDRSVKPALPTINRYIFNEQDFAPVYGKTERGLTGLKNLGNSCYMNSIIQCLSNTSTLNQYLLENNYEKHVNRSNKTKGHIVRTLAAVIKMLWSGECKYISSKQLKAVIGEQDNLFYGTDQQDSHEFLIMLIDWLQSDLQTIPVQQGSLESLPASEKAWLEYTKAKESFILRLFYGQIKSTVKCTVCSRESATYETFSNLSLELPPNNIDRCHINECFDMYFHGEMVKGWNCPYCKTPRDAIKKLDISKLPPVLVIHLKRFYADQFTSSFKKKTIYVDFPLSDMNMLPYVARTEKNNGSNSQHIYNLYAVSNHYGTMDSGHYTAFCKNYGQKKWYKFDDHTVQSLDRSDVKSSATYILFYTSLPESSFIGR